MMRRDGTALIHAATNLVANAWLQFAGMRGSAQTFPVVVESST